MFNDIAFDDVCVHQPFGEVLGAVWMNYAIDFGLVIVHALGGDEFLHSGNFHEGFPGRNQTQSMPTLGSNATLVATDTHQTVIDEAEEIISDGVAVFYSGHKHGEKRLTRGGRRRAGEHALSDLQERKREVIPEVGMDESYQTIVTDVLMDTRNKPHTHENACTDFVEEGGVWCVPTTRIRILRSGRNVVFGVVV